MPSLPDPELPNIATLFTGPLDRARLPYMVAGSVAMLAYGEGRNTEDVDIVLALNPATASRLPALFPEAEFYCPHPETLLIEVNRPEHGHFNIYHHASGLRADVYLFNAAQPFARWAMTRRQQVNFENVPIWLAPPEYVIVYKLEFFREGGSTKHLRDIYGMIRLTALDHPLLEAEIARRGLQEEWLRAQQPTARHQ